MFYWHKHGIIFSDQEPEIDLTIRNVFTVTLDIAAEWYNVGTILNISDGTLSKIRHDEGGNANSCLRMMLTEWLKMTDTSPTWSKLADAVQLFNHSTAEKIRTKYLPKSK